MGLALLVGEIALRAAGFSHPNFYRPDVWRGWSLRPGAEGPWRQEGASWVRINRAGLRDGEHPEAKPPGTLRIAVLGDSCVEALQVPDEETFVKRLERELAACPALGGRRVEALNFGVSGYGTTQELLILRREVRRYRPDVVLLAFYPGNDVVNNSRVLDGNRQRPYGVLREAGSAAAPAAGGAPRQARSRAGGRDQLTPDRTAQAPGHRLAIDLSFRDEPSFRFRTSAPGRLLSGLADRVRLLQLAKPARVAWRRRQADRRREGPAPAEPGLDDEVYRPPGNRPWREAWRLTEALIREMGDESRAHGAGFGVVVLTSGIQVHPDPAVRRAHAERLGVPDLLYPDRRLQALGREQGIPVLSLAPSLQELATRERVFLHGFPNTKPGLGHWNAQGHQAAARLIAPWICRELLARPEITTLVNPLPHHPLVCEDVLVRAEAHEENERHCRRTRGRGLLGYAATS